MAGFSLILLLWPVMMVCALAYLAFGAAAAIVTSPAFPLLVVSAITAAWGSASAVRVMWRRYKGMGDEPLRVGSFRRALVLYGISFIALCLGVWQAGVAIMALLSTT